MSFKYDIGPILNFFIQTEADFTESKHTNAWPDGLNGLSVSYKSLSSYLPILLSNLSVLVYFFGMQQLVYNEFY